MDISITLVSASVLLCFCIFFSSTNASKEYLVGGSTDAWKIPSSQSDDSLNKWAQSSRFRVGDSLVWTYETEKDSVLQVTKSSYANCNKTEPMEEYKDGSNTKVKLTRSGAYYFISGAEGHCEKGQKVTVVVLSSRKHRAEFLAPAPSPAEFDGGPAVAPSPTSGGFRSGGGSMVVFGAWLGYMML